MLTILFVIALLVAFGGMLSVLDHQRISSSDVITGVNAEYRMNAMQLRNI
jgi:Tfp pilus assembly protein PilX